MLNPASADGSNGWYKANVSLTWTVTETESPNSLQTTGCVNQNVTADQLETTYSCSAVSAGGSATQVDVKIKRDATAPTNVALTGGPTNGATYYIGLDTIPAAPTCSANDATSGIASCVVTGYSTAVGTHSVKATATDNAGNSADSPSIGYTVANLTLSGFFQPVDMGGVLNTVKGGSTVPMKFEVFAGSTELTATSIVQSFKTGQIACAGSAPSDEVEILSTGGTALRYDATAGTVHPELLHPEDPGPLPSGHPHAQRRPGDQRRLQAEVAQQRAAHEVTRQAFPASPTGGRGTLASCEQRFLRPLANCRKVVSLTGRGQGRSAIPPPEPCQAPPAGC